MMTIRRQIWTKIILPLVVLLIAAQSLAAYDFPKLKVINAGLGKQFCLALDDLSINKATIVVETLKGEVILSHQVIFSSNSFRGAYSLEAIREGKYTLILSLEGSEIRQPIQLTKYAVLYQMEQRQFVHSPEIVLDGRRLNVNLENPKGAAVSMQLKTAAGNILYEEDFVSLEEIEKQLNLLEIPEGIYVIEMETPVKKWRETFHLH